MGAENMSYLPVQQISGLYHRKIGDIVVTAVSDGYIDGNLDLLKNVSADEARAILVDAFRPVRRVSINAFLVHTKGGLVLIDTGTGGSMGATNGWIGRNLAAAGVDAKDVSAVLLTHMHPDHSAGLTDTSTGRPIFPNAELVMHEAEPRYWLDDAELGRAPNDRAKSMFEHSRAQIAPYKSRTRLFSGGEVFPGVVAMPIPGHTPGHSGYLISSGGQELLIWGDVVHVPEVQVALPDAGTNFDVDFEEARKSRKRVLDQVASDRILVAGMHLHFPGFYQVARQGNGYRLHAEAWQHAL
jgi:glyoxylase-like metal-dependent hydrolase (beta-lactamase superfamily II)